VKQSYRKLSKKYHPDLVAQKFSSDDRDEGKVKDYYTDKFSKVNDAYGTLSNKKSKIKYDLYGNRGRELVLRDEKDYTMDLGSLGEEDKYKESVKEAYLRHKRAHFDDETRVQVNHELSLDLTEFSRLTRLALLRPHSMVGTAKFQVPINKKNMLVLSSTHIDRGLMNQKHITKVAWRRVVNDQVFTDVTFSWHNQVALTTLSMYHSLSNNQHRPSQAYLQWHLLTYPQVDVAGFDCGMDRMISDERKLYVRTGMGLFSKSFTTGIASANTDISLAISKTDYGSDNTLSFVLSQPLDEEMTHEDDDADDEEETSHNAAELNHEWSITQGTPIQEENGTPSFDLTTTYMQSISEQTDIGIGVGSGSEGVHVDLVVRRGRNRVSVPCFINFEFHWKTFILASFLPAVCFNSLKRFVYGPYKRRKQINAERVKREKIYHDTAPQREAQQRQLETLMPDILAKKEQEMDVNGVVIMNARYGNLSEEANSFEMKFPPWIDVTDALQYYVVDHKIHIEERPFHTLKGFYDPCPGERKQFRVVYKFQNKLHEFQVKDARAFSLPLSAHFVKELNDDDEGSLSSEEEED